MTDRHDPLAGADPVPRARLDVVPLDAAREELLGEIMSGTTPSTGRRLLLPIIAAAAVIVVLAGGIWFAVGSNDDDPPPVASDKSTAVDSTESPTATRPDDYVGPAACRRFRSNTDTVGVYLTARLATVKSLGRLKSGTRYLRTRKGDWIVIKGKQCHRVLAGDPILKQLRRLRLPKGETGSVIVVGGGRGPKWVAVPSTRPSDVPKPPAKPSPSPTESPSDLTPTPSSSSSPS